MANALAGALSPYLQQHRDNPVDWREWSPDAFALARATDRPILLSIGYAACHWCHVMAHESFEDPEIAALMNRWFVNVKVDREERPDLDAVYQQALALLGEQGGWPLTMFLAPDGTPFWGGTYFPPEPRWGRPSFRQVLEQVAKVWKEERGRIEASRAALARALRQAGEPKPGAPPDAAFALEAGRSIGEELDPVHGGFGGAPKFPQAPALAFLLQVALWTADERLQARLLHTLRRICQGGIFDHLAGGFARYSVDAFWLVPHFEKMLYDNAQLIELLSEAWAITCDPLFAARIDETISWLRSEMMVDGAFAASLDADSEGEEGRFYLWDRDEIRALLGPEAPFFELAYGVSKTGNFEGRNILNRLHDAGLADAATEARLARCRAILREARARRPRPARDDKLLADWNGLAIAALARCGLRFAREDWIRLAHEVFHAVCDRLGSGDRLVHAARAGQRGERAFLDDYAQMIRAALALYETRADPALLERAERWMARATAAFSDGEGVWFLSEPDSDVPVRPRAAVDGPTPAASATLAVESARLFALTGDRRHRARTEEILTAHGAAARRHPFAHATLLSAALLLERSIQVVLTGTRGSAELASLLDVVARTALPSRVLAVVERDGALPAGNPVAGRGTSGAPAVAHVCIGTTCLAPAVSAADLAERLREARRLVG
ncbi:MAG: thioredoxin domain-containing protein [Geminicoccaceae bacterium]|nr:thioredoxin domain-containing protein [Geminicoccaceae bacterium]